MGKNSNSRVKDVLWDNTFGYTGLIAIAHLSGQLILENISIEIHHEPEFNGRKTSNFVSSEVQVQMDEINETIQ